MNFFQAIGSGFKNIFNFKSRASRSEFWYFCLFEILVNIFFVPLIIFIPVTVFISLGGNPIVYPTLIVLIMLRFAYILVFALCSLSLAVRRLHDIGRSGWWFFLQFTIIGIPFYLYFMVRTSDDSNNRYGPPSKARDLNGSCPQT